jgi:hypothetical protein
MLHDVQPDALRLALILVGSAAILAGAVALLTRFDHEYPKLKF